MLKEEQAAELLGRCEFIANRRLEALRGNLKRAETRAAAVWEMLVLEACAQVGHVEYEAPNGGPDIKLYFTPDRFAWIEVAYIHPRFEDEERKSSAVVHWIQSESRRIGFTGSIRCDFFGDPSNPAGPVRALPGLDEKKLFFRDPDVSAFMARLQSPLSSRHSVTLKRWTITLIANPDPSPFVISGGIFQKSPRTIKEHSVYRTLYKKIRQHKVDGPRIVCIGSDTSRAVALSNSASRLNLRQSLEAAMLHRGIISAVIVVDIASMPSSSHGWKRMATAQLYHTDGKTICSPLSVKELDLLGSIDFNRWRYSLPLNRHAEKVPFDMLTTSNALRISEQSDKSVKICVPGRQLIDALAGRASLIQACSSSSNSLALLLENYLDRGWRVENCSFIHGDVAKGLSELVELTLVPSHEHVYTHNTRMTGKAKRERRSTD
jgi:hypothetical protein